MKYIYYIATITLCCTNALILFAASDQCGVRKSLKELCFEAAAYRSAQPQGLEINISSSHNIFTLNGRGL